MPLSYPTFTGCPSTLFPSRRRPLHSAKRALVTSGNSSGRISGWLPSAARRRRCTPAPFPPSLRLRFTSPALRPQTEAVSKCRECPNLKVTCLKPA